MKKNILRVWITVLVLVLAGCTNVSSQMPKTSDTLIFELSPELLNTKVPPPVHDMRIKITTNSDWTTLKFVGGATLYNYVIQSSSQAAKLVLYF